MTSGYEKSQLVFLNVSLNKDFLTQGKLFIMLVVEIIIFGSKIINFAYEEIRIDYCSPLSLSSS